jgi:hypothetical protein
MMTLTQWLPEFAAFIQRLAAEYQQGNLTGWQQFRVTCEGFYTPERLATIENIIPGWQKMASYANQQTLIHITAVFTGLYSLPEFQRCNRHQQSLIEWIVLWHDIEKEPQPDKRDHTHGFRSAAVTAKALPSLGFEVLPAYATDFDEWYRQTHTASVYSERLGNFVQDNRRLPNVLNGIDRMFPHDIALVVKGVLLHMSLTVVQEWPAAAPLTDEEIRRCITPKLLPLLRIMMMVDNIAWALFEPERQADELQQTRAEFHRIKALIAVTKASEPE